MMPWTTDLAEAILEVMSLEGRPMLAREIAEALRLRGWQVTPEKVGHAIRNYLTHRVDRADVQLWPHTYIYIYRLRDEEHDPL